MSTGQIVALIAAGTSLLLGLFGLTRAARGWLRWSFSLGMLGFAIEAGAAFLLLGTAEAEDRSWWLQTYTALGLVALVPWGIFVANLLRPEGSRLPRAVRLGLVAAALPLLGAAAAILTLPTYEVADVPGVFYAARLDHTARNGVILALLGTVAILAGLEMALRTATREAQWRLKYLVLGLAAIFLIRFYLLSQELMFQVLMAVYVATGVATMAVGNLVVSVSLARGMLRGADIRLSRQLAFQSVVVAVLGVYLLVVGGLGWVLELLGIPEQLFWGSLIVFTSAVGLAALLLSTDVRWRIRRFIGTHFYGAKYDYRQQWVTFTKRLGSLVTLEELGPQLLTAVADAVGTTRAALYLTDEQDGRFHLATAMGVERNAPSTLAPDSLLVGTLRRDRVPLIIGGGRGGSPEPALELASWFPAAAVAVPFHWRETLTGLMLLGPERSGAVYSAEDIEFLTTVSEQAAGAIMTARLSETLVESREFEAFHRLTSFVIHDLKNSMSALSLLSQNALQHFDDPEFQRDAIKTLSRTVDRMRALLTRLSSAPESQTLRFHPLDLPALADEGALPVTASRIRLVKDLRPLPAVSGDAEALLRVIQNLVSNALEAIEGEGTITVRTYREDGWAMFSISDSGCGIAEEFIRRGLFSPFRSTKKGGWGIGLYQAKGIVESHGGRIEVSSKQGEGTTFRVRLPLEPGAVERTTA